MADAGDVYRILKFGTPEQRREWARGLPPNPLLDAAVVGLGSPTPGRMISALIPVIRRYAADAPELGAALASATHSYAVELFLQGADAELVVTTLSSLALYYVTASRSLGRLRDVLAFTAQWIPFYERWGESLHLPALKALHVDVFHELRSKASPPKTSLESLERFDYASDSDDDSDTLGVDEPDAPPSPVAAAPRPAPATPLESAPPPSSVSPPPVSTGFATLAEPDGYVKGDQPIAPGARYYFWLEVNQAPGSLEVKPTPLPVDVLPVKARLTVVLFTPDRAFRSKPGEDMGELELQPDGTARVVAQPAKRYAGASRELLKARLLFPVLAPGDPGGCRLRCSIYCRGVLVQSRLIDVDVGGTSRVSRVDYTLATRLDPARLGTLAEHRFSMLSNHRPGGNHDFYVYGQKGKKAFRDSIAIAPGTLSGALEIARAALRRASWGDEGPWATDKRYRYDGAPGIDTLREDLAVLAIAGWRIYDLLANQLAGGKKNLPELAKLVSEPGLVQISPDASLGMVLPAALIYDYRIKPQAKPAKEFELCAEFERAHRARTPFQETACFQANCPSKGLPTTICPSGFWGFRHGLGLPISAAAEGTARETELGTRLQYKDSPVIVLGVSRARDLPRTRQHTQELLALRPDWGARAWLVKDELEPLLEAMRSKQPHVVYLYCHGSGRPVGSTEIPMLYLGEDPAAAKPGEWLERSMLRDEIEWTTPRPLVFLNGCHTTVLDAQTTLDFVTGFVQNSNACGVVGTEVTVFEPLAGAFAKRFMERFLGGAMVGQAIRDARLDLLQEGNPLGLVYTPFVLSGTQLVKA